jgi:hypothetical protein
LIGGTAKAAPSGDAVLQAGLGVENVRRQNPEVEQGEGLIFGGKSCLLDSVSYKRTIDWFSFFVSICSLPPGILSPLLLLALHFFLSAARCGGSFDR